VSKDKGSIEKAFIAEGTRRYSQTNKIPLMQSEFVSKVGYLGELHGTEEILNGTFAAEPGMDPYAVDFITHLKMEPEVQASNPITNDFYKILSRKLEENEAQHIEQSIWTRIRTLHSRQSRQHYRGIRCNNGKYTIRKWAHTRGMNKIHRYVNPQKNIILCHQETPNHRTLSCIVQYEQQEDDWSRHDCQRGTI
jgi:hypothetical protein